MQIIALRKQLKNTQNLTQGNLFATPSSSSNEVIELEFAEIIEAINREMNRLGWSIEDGKKYISDRYNKKTRLHLNNEKLVEFWGYLKAQ